MRIKLLAIIALLGHACGDGSAPQQNQPLVKKGGSASDHDSKGSTMEKGSAGAPESDSYTEISTEAGDMTSSEEIGGGSQSTPQAGILTAGNFDDNLNFQSYLQLIASHSQTNLQGSLPTEPRSLTAITEPIDSLEILFVIDTTGSMGDELQYLQVEIASIVETIKLQNEAVNLSLGLVVYRDHQDAYVTKSFPFTSDAESFRSTLSEQGYDGGGDYPEAMDQAFVAASEFQWSAAKRIIFIVADAPPHSENVAEAFNAVDDLSLKGVTIYPVAASGVQADAEFVLRTAAIKTGGEYLFLTDDSGVGNSHATPSIPCYNVLLLKNQIINAVKRSLTGQTSIVEESKVLRTVGSPLNGVCQEQLGQ